MSPVSTPGYNNTVTGGWQGSLLRREPSSGCAQRRGVLEGTWVGCRGMSQRDRPTVRYGWSGEGGGAAVGEVG